MIFGLGLFVPACQDESTRIAMEAGVLADEERATLSGIMNDRLSRRIFIQGFVDSSNAGTEAERVAAFNKMWAETNATRMVAERELMARAFYYATVHAKLASEKSAWTTLSERLVRRVGPLFTVPDEEPITTSQSASQPTEVLSGVEEVDKTEMADPTAN